MDTTAQGGSGWAELNPNRLLKCIYISTEGVHDPGEPCKNNYDRQAKGESESCSSGLNPNPRTNKQTK